MALGTFRQSWLYTKLASTRLRLAVVSGALSPILAGAPAVVGVSGWWMLAWLVPSGICAGHSLAVGATRTDSADKRADAAAALVKVAVNNALTPLVGEVANIAEAKKSERAGKLNGARSALLATAQNLVGPDDVRICWYEIQQSPGTARQLQPRAHYGRQQSPRTVFVEGTADGDDALKMVDDDTPRRVPDIQELPDYEARTARRTGPWTYRSYCAASISARDNHYGMLTADSLTPSAFTNEDVNTLWLLATLLGAMTLVADGK